MADNGGLKEAYLAYVAWSKKHEPEPLLPGLRYNQKQLLWISAAQTWCSVSRDWYKTMEVDTDAHAPNLFRVLGPFQNNENFAKDFNCPTGSNMNPIQKCEVW